MERIAPLAKILAEANGIEWEHLPGTGPGGQIVEQDILDYLTRVMSGEAEPPSTPVDAPPPDWDGNDIPGAGMFDAAALSKAGVESDIAEFVSQGRPAGPQVPGTTAPALETSDFELDDSETQDNTLLAPAAQATPAVAEAPKVEPTPAPVAEQPAPSAAPAVAAAATTAAAGGLGSLLSRLYHKDDVAPAEPAHVEPAPAPQVEAAPRVEPVQVEPDHAEPAQVEPAVVAPVAEAHAAEEPHVAAPVAEAPAEVHEEVKAPAVVEPPRVEEQFNEPEPAPVVAQPAVEPAPTPQPAQPEVPATPAPAPVVPAPAQEYPREAVWFGTYLRRDANLSTLSDLRGQLTDALERDVPLALLVARAAQRHADLLGLNTVATQDIHANNARSVGTNTTGIRDAVTALDSNYDGTPDLLVVDAGSIGLDDLHYPHTLTLSVGRVQDGQASLSLQGNVETAKAAQFLAKVADTLEKPVILLV